MQESLLKALRSADGLRDEENAKAWFYRILRRTIIDLYRRRDARDRAAAELERELNVAPDTEEERIVCAPREGMLRFSPHFYNDEEEVNRVVDVLRALSSSA